VSTLKAKPVMVGASMGGNIALVTEGETPGTAHAIVLVDVVPQIEPAGVQRIIDFMTARPDGFADLEEAADAVAAYNPSRPRPSDPRGLAKNLRQGADGRWRWHWDPRFMQAKSAQREARVADIRNRMRVAAANIRIPTLLVRGAQSDVVSTKGVEALRALIPHMEATDVENAGHMVAGDRNDPFNLAVLSFLRRHAPPEPDSAS
jgi:pimeloyl-ACP methyl ester carboxylesterase